MPADTGNRKPFRSELVAAARLVARFENRVKTARAALRTAEQMLRDAKRNLKLLTDAVEPYEPPPLLTAEDIEIIDIAQEQP